MSGGEIWGRFIGFAFLVALVVGGVYALEEGPGWYQAWRCKPNVQGDLNQVVWDQDPKVEKCTGRPERATCFVTALDRGERTVAAVSKWDCRRRHLPDGTREVIERADAEKREDAQVEADLKHMGLSLSEMKEGVDYVFSKMSERRQVVLGGSK
jgi:hypothetical protein